MKIRSACPSDVEAILLILREVACQVPVKLDTSERIQAMKEQIKKYYLNRFSVVAVDKDGVVIGFQLAQERRTNTEGHHIYLAYAGVTSTAQGKKVFRQLIEAEQRHNLPLLAEVKSDNKSQMDDRLRQYGFVPSAYQSRDFRWDPK